MRKASILAAAVILFSSCSAQHKTAADKLPIGGGKDEHGCYTAAGYTWSQARQECVRLWEAGIRLAPKADDTAAQPTFIVFSRDRNFAEVLYPDGSRVLLTQKANRHVWTLEQNKIILSQEGDGITLTDKVRNLQLVEVTSYAK